MGNFNYRKLVGPLVLFLSLQIVSTIIYNYLPYEINRKLVFGLFGSNSLAIFISIMIFLILLLFVIFLKKDEKISVEMLLLIAAIVSNVFERFVYGGVLDYISFFNLNWFNLADLVIVLATIKIAYKLFARSN